MKRLAKAAVVAQCLTHHQLDLLCVHWPAHVAIKLERSRKVPKLGVAKHAAQARLLRALLLPVHRSDKFQLRGECQLGCATLQLWVLLLDLLDHILHRGLGTLESRRLCDLCRAWLIPTQRRSNHITKLLLVVRPLRLAELCIRRLRAISNQRCARRWKALQSAVESWHYRQWRCVWCGRRLLECTRHSPVSMCNGCDS